MSSAAKAYLRQVNSRMFCPRSVKAAFLRQLEDDIFLYCEEHTDVDRATLNARFGTPDAVAEEFLGALDPMVFSHAYRSRQRTITLAIALLAAVVVLMTGFAIRKYRAEQNANGSIELVPYEGELPEASGPGYWVRTNNGKDISYWEFDYNTNEWVNVTIPSE